MIVMAISYPNQDKSLPCPSSQDRTEIAEHLAKLPGGPWAVWRWMALRGAGFPVEMLLSLAVSRCGAAADAMNEKEELESAAYEAAIAAVQQGFGEAGQRQSSREKTVRLLKNKDLLDALESNETTSAANAHWRACCQEFEQAQEIYFDEFKAAVRQVSKMIRNVARRNDFREAVAWQNRRALRTGIDALLRKESDESRSSKLRQHEQLVANYLQRYCAKNDTIGFFGPVGWARVVPAGPPIQTRVGESVVAQRNLYFESWCIDALVEHFGNHHDVRPWFAPRRTCAMYYENGTVYLPFKKPARITPAEQALLAACDGRRTANRIAAEMVGNPNVALYTVSEVFELLDSMQTRAMVWWKFELPRAVRPEIALRKAIAQIGEEGLRAPLEKALDELEAAFFKVKAAAGDAERIDESLGELEVTFNRLTGKAATRSAGKTYAGRTLVYEDCVRDAEINIGPEILAGIGPALGLVLTSCRWFSYAVSQFYRKVLRNIYTSLAKSAGTPRVDFVSLWMKAEFYFFDGHEEILSVARTELQKRWAKILDPAANRSRLHFSSDSLQQVVAKEFTVPKRLGSFARYHSPDLLFAARDVNAFNEGDYEAVLGELHASTNTLGWPLFIEQHPSPQDLFQALDSDFPEPRLLPIVPKGLYNDVTRVFPALVSPKDYQLDLLTGPTEVPDSRYIPLGALIVEEDGDELTLRTRDGRVKFDLLEGLAQFLEMVTANEFKMLRVEKHLPRITVDRLVICRETWSFAVADLKFAFYKEEPDRYSAARKWVAQHKLPRFIFVKFPGEDKPVYTDFDSPIYVEILAKMVRRAAAGDQSTGSSLTITEMLPTMEQSWLPGASGETYTCELRMVAVDLLQDRTRRSV